MATIVPDSDDVKRAIQWISQCLEEKPDQSLQKLVDQAVFKFDLSPLDSEFLIGFFKKR